MIFGHLGPYCLVPLGDCVLLFSGVLKQIQVFVCFVCMFGLFCYCTRVCSCFFHLGALWSSWSGFVGSSWNQTPGAARQARWFVWFCFVWFGLCFFGGLGWCVFLVGLVVWFGLFCLVGWVGGWFVWFGVGPFFWGGCWSVFGLLLIFEQFVWLVGCFEWLFWLVGFFCFFNSDF